LGNGTNARKWTRSTRPQYQWALRNKPRFAPRPAFAGKLAFLRLIFRYLIAGFYNLLATAVPGGHGWTACRQGGAGDA